MKKYQLWKENKTENNLSDIKKFSRKNLTQQLVNLLKDGLG